MMLEAALGRSWTGNDAKRLNDRLDQQAEESLSEEAYDFYCGHFLDVLFDPEPEYEAILEAAIYGELAYLRSNGDLGQPSSDEDDKTMVSHVLSDLDIYLDLNNDLARDQEDDDMTAIPIQEDDDEDCADVDDEDDDRADVDDGFNEDDEAIVMSAIFKWRSCGVARMCVDEEEEEGICVVCQDALEQGDGTITTIACQHEFHTKCIGRWLRESASCPLCNAYPYHD